MHTVSLELQRDAARTNHSLLAEQNAELESKLSELEIVTEQQFLELQQLSSRMAELQGDHEGEQQNLRTHLMDLGWTCDEVSVLDLSRTVTLPEVKHGRVYDVQKALEVARLCSDFNLHGRKINALIHRTLSIFTGLNQDTLQKLVPVMGPTQMYRTMDVLSELTHEVTAPAFLKLLHFCKPPSLIVGPR